MIRFTLFWLIAVLWLAVALPILLWSIFTLEVPLWPDFSVESTTEGIMVWATAATVFYVTPVLLFLNRKAGRRPSKMLVIDAQD